MGTEIIVITIANLALLAYSLAVRLVRFILEKVSVVKPEFGSAYEIHAVIVFGLTLLPSLSFLWTISADHGFAVRYILIIQLPIILVNLWVLMSFSAWKNITSQLTSRLRRRTA